MKQKNLDSGTKRKATPEEVDRYNSFLKKESSRLNLYKDLKIASAINVEGKYSTTAMQI